MPSARNAPADDRLDRADHGRPTDHSGSRTRALLRCGVVGPLLFIAVFLVEGATRAGYDPLRQPVSALATGDRGWVQIANFTVTGGLVTAFAVGVHRHLPTGPGARWGPRLLAVFGAGLFLSGVFVMDPMLGYPPGAPAGVPSRSSWHHQLHGAAGLVVFSSLPAAAIVFARRFRRTAKSRLLPIHATATGLLVAGGFVAFAAAMELERSYAGLVQRITIVIGWSWIAMLATHLDRSTEDRP